MKSILLELESFSLLIRKILFLLLEAIDE